MSSIFDCPLRVLATKSNEVITESGSLTIWDSLRIDATVLNISLWRFSVS
jgi:hypothetical protein